MNARSFDLGDVLSVTTGILMSPRHMEGIYDILNFMTGGNLFTHQLPRACREVAPIIIQQHPQLAAIELDTLEPEFVGAVLAGLKHKYGDTLALTPMADYAHMHPIEELLSMRGAQ